MLHKMNIKPQIKPESVNYTSMGGCQAPPRSNDAEHAHDGANRHAHGARGENAAENMVRARHGAERVGKEATMGEALPHAPSDAT